MKTLRGEAGLGLPVIIAHLVLEGWTRPPSLPAKGLARPGVRRAALMVLISTTTAFTTFALLTARS